LWPIYGTIADHVCSWMNLSLVNADRGLKLINLLW